MKKSAVLVCLFLLSGCSVSHDALEIGMEVRSKLLQSSGCSFISTITADYGDKIHIFSMKCQADSKGNLEFEVTEPDVISGIAGHLSEDGGDLTFDDTALHFELLAEEQLSPISAPWILIRSLRSGYVTSSCTEDDKIRLSIDDSFQGSPLKVDIWLNSNHVPNYADILYDGKRILSVTVESFEIL